MTLADKIKTIRLHKRLSQVELAVVLEISQAAVQKLESGGNKEVSQSTLAHLVYKLGVNPYFILGDDKKEPVFSPAKDSELRKKIKQFEVLADKLASLKTEK